MNSGTDGQAPAESEVPEVRKNPEAHPRPAPPWRRPRVRILFLLGILGAMLALGVVMIFMPGESYRGALPDLDESDAAVARALRDDVETLATRIGERHVGRPKALEAAAEAIETSLTALGLPPTSQEYDCRGVTVRNLEVEIPGATRANEVVIFGAHYDSIPGSPAANDNASGVASLLALARAWSPSAAGGSSPAPPQRTLRFVFFTNEEPPWFQTPLMGSWVYARRSKQRGEKIVAMISLETLGYYSDAPGSQQFPNPLLEKVYPTTGNFVAFVGGVRSGPLVRAVTGAFRRAARFPSEGAAIPDAVPGIGWSDHWSFSSHGYPALMVTDTAPFRYPHYHMPTDTPEKLDYERMARVLAGLRQVVDEFANPTR